MCARSLQLCLTLCDPVGGSPPGSSVRGILQVRPLEWVAMASSNGSSQPRDRTHVSLCLLHWQMGSLPLVPPGKPNLAFREEGKGALHPRSHLEKPEKWIKWMVLLAGPFYSPPEAFLSTVPTGAHSSYAFFRPFTKRVGRKAALNAFP